MPGSPFNAVTAKPESSASAGRPLTSAAARAFSSALPANVFSVSSGSIRPSSAAPFASMPSGRSRSLISRTLPGLCEATTRVFGNSAKGSFLCGDEFADAFAREAQEVAEFFFAERCAFGGALNLDEATGAGENEVRVGLGGRIFRIIEVQHGHALDDPARHGGDVILQRGRLHHAGPGHELDALGEGDI